jgi:hypothetical protein
MAMASRGRRLRYRFDGCETAVPIEAARRLRDEARDTLNRGTDPSVAHRACKQLEAQTFNAIFDRWLVKLETDVGGGTLATASLKRTRWLLTKYFVPTLGRRPIRLIQPSELSSSRPNGNTSIWAPPSGASPRTNEDETTASGTALAPSRGNP